MSTPKIPQAARWPFPLVSATPTAPAVKDSLTAAEALRRVIDAHARFGWSPEVDEAIHAGRAALAAQGVPAGWKLVPVEPTPEMIEAAWLEYWKVGRSLARGLTGVADKAAYRAMLAATPAPAQAQQAEPLTQAQRIRLWNNSPQLHGDVVGRNAFERLVKLVESVHRIGASSGGAA